MEEEGGGAIEGTIAHTGRLKYSVVIIVTGWRCLPGPDTTSATVTPLALRFRTPVGLQTTAKRAIRRPI